jgi:hypothetical protein
MPIKPLKLTAKQREYIQARLERDHGDAELWKFPEFRRQALLSEHEEGSGLNWLDALRRNIHLRHQASDEECEAELEIELFSTGLRERGVARRIAFDNLSDLRTALSLDARMDWFQRGRADGSNDGCYPDAWDILRGLAARDLVVARRFFGANDKPLKRGHRPTVQIYNGLLAILTQDKSLQSQLLGTFAKEKATGPYKAILTALGGIIAADPAAVAAGLDQVMSTFRRLDLFEEDKIICFLAHGLAELSLHQDPDLLKKFDVEQGQPWDAAYFRWLRDQSPNPTYPELAKKSKLLDKWFNRLEPPSWWEEGD